MSRGTLLPFGAVASLLCVGVAAAGTARPGIALGHRIGLVSFGEPRATVTYALGRGVSVRLAGARFRFYSKGRIYVAYPPPGVRQRVSFIVTRSARYKTRSGVGVGSSLRQLRRGVSVKCYGSPVPTTCQHENANINLPLTVFNIDSATKRVTEVAIRPRRGLG